MDIESQASQWAKSTQSRIEMFLDDFLIRSPISKVRSSSQRLILSLFKKGNEEQRLRIMSLLQSRCQHLVWMGKATQDFLGLVKNIFGSTTSYAQYKSRIIKKIFSNLQIIHKCIISNPNYQFYTFASNLIDFGNEEFKPYLLEANGCLNCFGRTQTKSQPFKIESFVQTYKIFTNKLEYVFKRIYDVKDLNINIKTNGRMRNVTVSYLDENKEYKKIGKFKPNQIISLQHVTLQGLHFDFDITYSGFKKRVQCIFCGAADDVNCVCQNCLKKTEGLDISGQFRVIGADQKIISEQLCNDYQRIQQNLATIKNLHAKIQSKQKITLNFTLDEMVQTYQKIVNNLGFLHQKDPSKLKAKQNQNCFSCNYYQIVYIIKFLKEILKKCDNIPLSPQQISKFKETLRECLAKNQIESLKVNLHEAIAVFIVNIGKPNFKEQFNSEKNKYLADLISKVLIALKEKRSTTQVSIDDELAEIRQIIQQKQRQFKIQQKIKIFVCYFLDWEFLTQVFQNTFSHTTQINQLTMDQLNQLKSLVNFDLSEVFNLPLDSYLKAFLKILPPSILPSASLDIDDCEFLQYVDNKIPQIQKSKIQESIICCPNPMIKLDMFTSLPILVSKLPVKESMKVMNSLFPFRNVWNLNITKACNKFQTKLSQLPSEEQISMCLYGYAKSKQQLYIQKLYKLLVPQRVQFIIRLQAPHSQIDALGIQYPYLPIRQVKSEDLQGDTIKALHDWVYSQLVKLNQAMPLDIIVEKNIIDNMDFPIELVYQNIAQNKSKKKIGDKQYDFFKVIYRIQGVLGQPKQRSIGNLRDQKLETCISLASHFLNKFSDQFSKKIGLDILIQILQEIQPGPQSQDKKVLLFEILSTLSMNEAICKKIVEGQYGDSIINATVKLMSFQNQKDAKITNFLLQLSSKVIDEANQQMINLRKGSVGEYRKMSGAMDIQTSVTESDSEKKVKYVLEKINECQSTFQKTGNVLYRDIEKKLIKLLPFCSKDETQSTKLLFNFFEFSQWATKPSSKLQNLFIFVDSLSESYMTFKGIAKENGVTNEILKTITNNIRKQGKQQIDEKKLSVSKSLTESALLLLCALVQGDQHLQGELFQSKLFHNIYQISQIPPKKAQEINAGRVPQNCYKIIKYLGQGKIVEHSISTFLQQKKKIQKQKAEPKKNKKWQTMKNKQKVALSKKIQDQGADRQKDLIICSSCQQGYSMKKDILGLYIYLTKNQIPLFQALWWKDNRRFPSLTSTTFFTAIHFQCHMRAFEADQKIGRNQWDGALIRNMDVLCNSWIPFKGPKTTNDQFSRSERKYFERNKNGNYWNVVNDLQSLIEKLSIQFDFATESKGSSSSHNCRYIPILIGFACHMIERGGGCNILEEGIAALLENPPKKLHLINLMVCYSIFSMSYSQFTKNKPKYLKWITDLKSEQPQQKQFPQIKPNLVFLKIVQQIFQIIHKPMQVMNSTINPPLKIYKQLDAHIATNMQHIVPQFQTMNSKYKSKYIKCANIGEFQF